MSIWERDDAIREFSGNSLSHIRAANSAFREVVMDESGPVIWSAQFRLIGVSKHNLNWRGKAWTAILERAQHGQ
jgi:hypothetical protein